MINKRHIEIIYYIFKENINDIKYLSSKFNVSDRMLRYDIEEIIFFFDNIIEVKSNKIIIKLTLEELDRKINDFEIKNYSFNLIEQEYLLMLDILLFKNKFKINYFEENYGISRTTIQKLIKSINNKFLKYNMKIVSNSNKGYILNFNELNLRKFLINILIKINMENSKNPLFLKIINKKLNMISKNIDIKNLEKNLFNFFNKQKIIISDYIFKVFLYFIFISY